MCSLESLADKTWCFIGACLLIRVQAMKAGSHSCLLKILVTVKIALEMRLRKEAAPLPLLLDKVIDGIRWPTISSKIKKIKITSF